MKKSVRLTLRWDRPTLRRILRQAREESTTPSALIRRAVAEYLEIGELRAKEAADTAARYARELERFGRATDVADPRDTAILGGDPSL